MPRNCKASLRLVGPPSVPLYMALDPRELAKELERLRLARGQSKEKAAQFTGVSLRQYRRLTSDDPPPARLSTIERIADAYNVDVAELIGTVTHTNGTLTDRLQRLEDHLASNGAALQTILEILRDDVLPALPAPRPARAARKATATRTKGRRAQAS